MARQIAAVIGGGTCSAEEREQARAIGRGLAEAGLVVVTGGRGGVMEAASLGAREAGGLTIGLLPGRDLADANPHLDVALPTDLGAARNALVVGGAAVVVAVGGGAGTLSEIALAVKRGVPVVTLGSWTLEPDRLAPGARLSVAGDAAHAVSLAVREV